MKFGSVGGKWRPTCSDVLGCKARRKDPPKGEFWLDIEDCAQEETETVAEPVAQVPRTFANLLGDDGLAWCFDCKPVGIGAVEHTEKPCNACEE
jgi:hypothetical protein